MKKLRKRSLVKWDYDSFPKKWKDDNPNLYEEYVFCYLGNIPNMPGHCLCICINIHKNKELHNDDIGRTFVIHPEELIELTEEET